MYYVVSVFVCLLCYSCKEKNYSKVVDRLNTENFDEIKGYSIHYRSPGKSKGSSIYVVSKYNSTCSPYFVEINDKDVSVLEVNRGNILENCNRVNLGQEQLKQLIESFVRYDVVLATVDNNGNVFINPFSQDKPTLIKKNTDSLDTTGFKKIYDNWFAKIELN